MKRLNICYLCIVILTLCAQPEIVFPGGAGHKQSTPEPTHRISGGVRWHADYPGFQDLPLEQGDRSYHLMYEYHEPQAFWQIGATYAPSSSDDRFDSILTPQLNLIFKDSIFRLGGGILASRVETDTSHDWTNIFWQVCFGISVPVGSHFGIDVYGHYVFEKWGTIFDSDRSGLDYSAVISIGF